MYDHLIEIQPNRKPFLFIDTIVECNEEKNSRTIKYLNKDEWYFKCHWENDPNMPAMLQLEAMSQTASMCLFSLNDPPEKLYLVSVDKASFRKKIIPKMRIEITSIFLEKVKNIYEFKSIIREQKTRHLISKSFLKLLWPKNNC